MGLFAKKEEPVVQEARPIMKTDNKEPIASVIAKEMTIIGEVSFKGKARIDGQVNGNIKGEYLILSDTAQVNGDIEVGTLVCHGKVDGNINAEIITAHTTASIHGTLKSENLTVESGAALEGEIHASSRKLRRKDGVPDSTAPQTAAGVKPVTTATADKTTATTATAAK